MFVPYKVIIYSYIIVSKIVAVVNLVDGITSDEEVTTGLLLITQSSDSSVVSIRGRISNLKSGTHGFHVHTTGATTSDCSDAGGHFNPTSVSIRMKTSTSHP